MRKRSASNVPCDENIQNDDIRLLNGIKKIIRCVPPYWQYLDPNCDGLKVCQSEQQLQDASNLITHYKDIMSTYHPPCVDMTSVDLVTKDLPQTNTEFLIKIIYTDDYYQEIQNSRDFSFETFFSGVGGFVGIFLGYSIFQIPELFTEFLSLIRRLKYDPITRKL